MVMQIVLSIIIVVTIVFYILKLSIYKEKELGQRILGLASQLTYSAFILGFGLVMIWLNIIGLGRGKFVFCLLLYAAFVSSVNALGIIYFEHKLNKEENDRQ